jgi:misacylated tRNA(Ala) deacylase
MPTDLICHRDATIREFDATVTAVVDGGAVLDRTAFYPGGGGQPCDVGELTFDGNSVKVTKVGRKDGEIVHEIEGEAPAVGAAVHGKIDWENRHALMRTHTALHISAA